MYLRKTKTWKNANLSNATSESLFDFLFVWLIENAQIEKLVIAFT